jgi:hypothetical protein
LTAQAVVLLLVWAKFHEHGIETQRDLHLRSSEIGLPEAKAPG